MQRSCGDHQEVSVAMHRNRTWRPDTRWFCDPRVLYQTCTTTRFLSRWQEVRWPSGRASDSGARGRGSILTQPGRRVVSLGKIHLPPKSTGNTLEAVAPSRHD